MFEVASFFSGAGGLDLGFTRAGFKTVFANDYEKKVKSTYELNHLGVPLDNRSIELLTKTDIPDVDGFIGGPPCQSWSEAGKRLGAEDPRGQLFFKYVELLGEKRPSFFLAENVSGFLFEKNREAREAILTGFASLGYNVSYGLLNVGDFGVPQDRERVIIVGYRNDWDIDFAPPATTENSMTLGDAIADLPKPFARTQPESQDKRDIEVVPNHEFFDSKHFSPIYMSRNRVRGWDEKSFTIQASAAHVPLHPQAPKMEKVAKDKWEFAAGHEHLYRRLSVRECADVQTFPRDFFFDYSSLLDGYRMVGNAVPVNFAEALARQIHRDLARFQGESRRTTGAVSRGTVTRFN